jgi:hypothetical protein
MSVPRTTPINSRCWNRWHGNDCTRASTSFSSTRPAADRAGAGTAVVEATSARLLWEALNGIYEVLGLSVVGDEAFRALVLARIIEPVSKLDTVRVLNELGVSSPSLSTFMRCLKRVVADDYRVTISEACFRHASHAGALGLVLDDVTTLYFETPREDRLRKVGMSKERRVDPQSRSGCSPTARGSRWRCTCSKATRPRPRP